MPRKAYSVDEADALIPLLERVLDGMAGHQEAARRHHDRLQVLELLWGERLDDAASPDHAEAVEARAGLLASGLEVERLYREEIVERGLRLPSGGLEHGLVDFPTTWRGRWVYLCWRRGEPAVTHWHEVDAGYAGRQEITPEQRQRMGRDDDPARLDDSALDF